ncbi:hypothetical protein SORBI_3007G107950 [Sorghum bicolor]|uniref:Uncharacterized protein n=1 Tax=Sorghum bicolor TaxID=4558 RepID=A0A1Z5RAA3_SORBI|nr:hypothetical protein SORBI_3007G107950 [Sorghum bicolor]
MVDSRPNDLRRHLLPQAHLCRLPPLHNTHHLQR